MSLARNGVENSQALRDWLRATSDLRAAQSGGASTEIVSELTAVVNRAQARVRSLHDRA
jgi:hypothetical protein